MNVVVITYEGVAFLNIKRLTNYNYTYDILNIGCFVEIACKVV